MSSTHTATRTWMTDHTRNHTPVNSMHAKQSLTDSFINTFTHSRTHSLKLTNSHNTHAYKSAYQYVSRLQANPRLRFSMDGCIPFPQSICPSPYKSTKLNPTANNPNTGVMKTYCTVPYLIQYKNLRLGATLGKQQNDALASRGSNTCRTCNSKMVFKEHNFSTSCHNIGAANPNCTSKHLYECLECSRGYCTNCAYPPNIDLCDCGTALSISSDYNHYCDLCNVQIFSSFRRCYSHDYDVCNSCYDKRKIN